MEETGVRGALSGGRRRAAAHSGHGACAYFNEGRRLRQNRQQGLAAQAGVIGGGDIADGNFFHALEALDHDFHVRLHNRVAQLAELLDVLLVTRRRGYCSCVMPNSCSMGLTAKNAPRKALPCMRSCRSARSVALRAISKPGSVKTRIFFWMICWRAQMGRFCQARSPSTSDSQTRLPPSCMPSSGLVCVKALGSQQRTTVTWRRSQLTRMRSLAATMK